MKKTILLLFVLFATVLSYGQSAADTAAINEAVMNYLEGYYTADGDRVEKAIHPDLAKRVVYSNQKGQSWVQSMTAMSLYSYTKQKEDESVEHVKLKAEIEIYDIFGNIATVKAVTEYFDFIDYCQLGKVNGEWKIINVLWAMKPKE